MKRFAVLSYRPLESDVGVITHRRDVLCSPGYGFLSFVLAPDAYTAIDVLDALAGYGAYAVALSRAVA